MYTHKVCVTLCHGCKTVCWVPLWWSSGQRAWLQLHWSEFESRWSKIVVEKNKERSGLAQFWKMTMLKILMLLATLKAHDNWWCQLKLPESELKDHFGCNYYILGNVQLYQFLRWEFFSLSEQRCTWLTDRSQYCLVKIT